MGKLSVSKEGLRERDRIVLTACRERGIPLATVMSGGYADPVEDSVDIHFATVALAAEISGSGGSRSSVPLRKTP